MSDTDTADIFIAGGGPGGAVCGLHLARAGLRVVLVDRASFPRHKVCGDCLNPDTWDVFDRAGVTENIRALPHVNLAQVEFRTPAKSVARVDLPPGERGETAIERRLMDSVLLNAAKEAGVTVIEGSAVTGVERVPRGWRVRVQGQSWGVPVVVGADGRNSTIARMTGRLPRARRGRVAVQTHVPLPKNFGPRVALWLLPGGYAGLSPVSETMLNLCLVSTSSRIASLQRLLSAQLNLPGGMQWHSIAPLTRGDAVPASEALFLVGDAARVVEPFTGEGTYYAMRTGELAAASITRWLAGNGNQDAAEREYITAHKNAYRGRFWVNQFARFAVTVPGAGAGIIHLGRLFPPILHSLTSRITKSRGEA